MLLFFKLMSKSKWQILVVSAALRYTTFHNHTHRTVRPNHQGSLAQQTWWLTVLPHMHIGMEVCVWKQCWVAVPKWQAAKEDSCSLEYLHTLWCVWATESQMEKSRKYLCFTASHVKSVSHTCFQRESHPIIDHTQMISPSFAVIAWLAGREGG